LKNEEDTERLSQLDSMPRSKFETQLVVDVQAMLVILNELEDQQCFRHLINEQLKKTKAE
jgi:hypothetical protein